MRGARKAISVAVLLGLMVVLIVLARRGLLRPGKTGLRVIADELRFVQARADPDHPYEHVTVLPVEGVEGLYVAICDFQPRWFGTFECFRYGSGGVQWSAEVDVVPTEQFIDSVRGFRHEQFAGPLIEVFGMTHMGNGFLYLYELRGRRLHCLLKTRALDWHDDGVLIRDGKLTVTYADVDADGRDDVLLTGIVDRYGQDRDERTVLDSRPCRKVCLWNAGQAAFVEDLTLRKGWELYEARTRGTSTAPAVGMLAPDARHYRWTKSYDPAHALAFRIRPPPGFRRVPASKGSFAHWLRHLPLKPGRPEVKLHDGRTKPNQHAHHAVLDLDVGSRDLQQCADAVIRLRAEFLFATGRADEIHFNFTSGDRADFEKWSGGWRPVVKGDKVAWRRSAMADGSYATFRKYLDTIFTYAGSASLSKELEPVRSPKDIRCGDVFIHGGFPGHAIVVLDVVAHPDGRKVFLLAQSYMPAQDVHLLVNPNDANLSPWYDADFADQLRTPEWTFRRDELMRFGQ